MGYFLFGKGQLFPVWEICIFRSENGVIVKETLEDDATLEHYADHSRIDSYSYSSDLRMLQPLKHILSQKQLILASGSPQRKEILKSVNLKFDIVVSTFEENLDPKKYLTNVHEYTIDTARHKCIEVYNKLKQHQPQNNHLIVVSADTMCSFGNVIYGKPTSNANACEILKTFRGNTHQVYTGVCIMYKQREYTFYECTDVTMDDIDDQTVELYVETGEPVGKAGAYAIQGIGATLIKKINGDYFNVVGFPLNRFCVELRRILHDELSA
ncbi:unnamed protein product [Didymodactylos carnosus]|uniref:Uncharacterized protein n=1 Tax=Didymodactylos carnosus TaxID=1234261 RepID=A0A814GH19_9BILA|nr:unnamed protein product [Didymodactylos carnosus]CAF0996246.1 unnamed protein product [Didymodactylos carnosus]CAF3723363.1 unnamed protein product [Didymodactylos carnosus]CAF3767861.1 unnamed protein product [Didymodactylos carnosus]